ncbi:MAG: IS256 family transposase [Burkholderiales bacterium]
MDKYQGTRIAGRDELGGVSLPGEVQLALDDLAGSVREGLLALSVGVGLKVLDELLEEELVELVGPKGKHNPERSAGRHGSRRGQVVLGGRKVQVRRPRARTREGRELALQTYAHFASDDLLCERTVQTMLAGLSTRRHRRALEPTGVEGRSVSKSAVSRRFVARTRRSLAELMARPVPDDLVVLMLDGVVLAGSTCLCALAIRADGTKVPLGLWEGASENAAVCRRALADLAERGLSAERGLLVVIDGSKALRKAVGEALGAKAAIQRCRRHKEQNVLGHLPEFERPWVKGKLREAWAQERADLAERRLQELARALEAKRPGAATSLREGVAETLTITHLGVHADSTLGRTLATTNPIESMLSICRERARNVKRWRGGEMALRWTAAGMLDAERSFRRVKGFRGLGQLATALRRHAADVDGEEVRDFPTAA